MNISNVSDPRLLTSYFQSGDEKLVNRMIYLLDKSFRSKFKSDGRNICNRWPVAKNRWEEVTDISFNEGLFNFYLKIKQDGFVDKGVSVENVLKVFFLNKLKGQLTKLYRESLRITTSDPDIIFSKIELSLSSQPDNEESTIKEKLFAIAYKKLKANCRNLIEYRKLLRMKNEEIAARLGLQENSVNSEVYKCMNFLKKTISDMILNKNNLQLT